MTFDEQIKQYNKKEYELIDKLEKIKLEFEKNINDVCREKLFFVISGIEQFIDDYCICDESYKCTISEFESKFCTILSDHIYNIRTILEDIGYLKNGYLIGFKFK